MIITKTTQLSADSLRDIARQAYAQYISAIGKEPAPMVADYAAHIHNDTIFAAHLKDEIVGFAIIINKQDVYWLETIAVLPDQSGRGIGTALIAAVEAYLKTRTTAYHLYTNAKMTQNKSWYEKLGFTLTGEREDQGYQRLFFSKTLSKI